MENQRGTHYNYTLKTVVWNGTIFYIMPRTVATIIIGIFLATISIGLVQYLLWSHWPWPRYPKHFEGVNCDEVPETPMIRPNDDIPSNLRAICWKERAWFENVWQFCAKVGHKDNCYTWMAIKLRNESICNQDEVDIEKCKQIVRDTASGTSWHDEIEHNPL